MTTSQQIALKQITKIYKDAASNLSYFNADKIAEEMERAERLMRKHFPEDYIKMIKKRKSSLSLAV